MARHDPAKLTRVVASLPFGLGSFEWEADETERRAAWALYVELVTRVAVQRLGENEGLLREVLNSLYTLYPTTRGILKDAGPSAGATLDSVGGIALAVLNRGLRPFTSKWHPRLEAWEALCAPNASIRDHERQWPEAAQMRAELATLRNELDIYAQALAQIAGVADDRQAPHA
jgi:hypothetical protein